MISKAHLEPARPWDPPVCNALIDELSRLREAMVARARDAAALLRRIHPTRRASAVNLEHYLALRAIDLTPLQERLSRLGISSLGRAEAHALSSVDKVIGILHRLAGRRWTSLSDDEPAGFRQGNALLDQHAAALFGPAPANRRVRIMVTLPADAAHDKALVDGLVAAGMDVARINCAHDSAAAWIAMAANVRRAAKKHGRSVRVQMDLGGPKLRTGPIEPGPTVMKLKPARNALGEVTAPWQLALRAPEAPRPADPALPCLIADAQWLEHLHPGDRIDLTDARGAHRQLSVVACDSAAVLVQCGQTTYLTADTDLRLRHHGHAVRTTRLGGILVGAGAIRLNRGDRVKVVAHGKGHGADPAANRPSAMPATVVCTLPEALAQVRKGDRIWFDDGRIGGIAKRCAATGIDVEITEARDGGERLGADKGINLPDTLLDLPALTAKDRQDLEVVAQYADIAGLSFAQSAADVKALRKRLVALGASHVAILLKVETRRGFEQLPDLLRAAMAGPAAGIMIARGDLAVECGFERMAELQEEILWICEAAHMPVVWATQVLETLAATGRPSRAEITDAAMGARAECVMLNKGPHIVEAIDALDDILKRMQTHQSKKRPLLRALKAWSVRPPGGRGCALDQAARDRPRREASSRPGMQPGDAFAPKVAG